MAKEISKTEFVQDVQNGVTKSELSNKYELPVSVVSKWVKDLGLKLKRSSTPKYILVDKNEQDTEG